MKKDYTKYLAAAVGVIVTTAIIASATYAYQGDVSKKGPNFSPERHEAMINAIDTQDYSAWKELMGDNPITEKITEENFAKFVEARQLMVDGKYEEAKALREELGLQNKKGFKKGQDEMHQKRGFNKENATAIKEALENNDYDKWKELTANRPMGEEVTEENFSQMVEMHSLMQAGNFEEAKELREELGLNFGHKMGMPQFAK